MKIKRFRGDKACYFIAAILLLVLGVLLIPSITDLGQKIINLLISIGIFAYLFLYLRKKFKGTRQVIFVLTAIEFSLMALIGLGLVFTQFGIISITGGCKIMGLAFALRGIVEMFRAYFHQGTIGKYPLWQFVLNVLVLIAGVYMFAAPFITDYQMTIVLMVVAFVFSFVCLTVGFTLMSEDKKR